MRALAIAITLLLAMPSGATSLLEEDFEDGKTEGWAIRGEGDVRITVYAGNKSLRLQKRAEALTAFSAGGQQNIAVAARLAALDLEPGEACVLEASADRGKSWFEAGRVRDGQDDGVTLWAVGARIPELANTDPVFVRVRAEGNAEDDSCWADAVRASGDAIALAAAPRLDSAAFSVPPAAPIAMAAFAPGPGAAPPSRRLEGRLTLSPVAEMARFKVYRDRFAAERSGPSFAVLPALSVDFTTDGEALIPAERGPLRNATPDWEWMLAPGTLWDEPGEPGWTRAAVPFSLRERNANCTHHGVLTFRFTDAAVSDLVYQIVSETCAYFQADLWGLLRAKLASGPVPDSSKLVEAHRAEVAARMPRRPIEEIGSVFPGANAGAFGSVAEVDPEAMTAYGFVVDGVHWSSDCRTRMGPHPFCDGLDIPSYSVAKSAFAGLALMRLELLQPGIKDKAIHPLVSQCSAERWGAVRLQDALNMATGNFSVADGASDEDSERMLPFFRAEQHDEKARLACAMFPKSAKPGTRFAYHTIDTYLLGSAMQAVGREQQPAADIHRDFLVKPIWEALRLSPAASATMRTYDAAAQPWAGWGLTFQRDDIARLASFLQGGGMIAGKAVVDPAMLAASLQRTASERGLVAGSPTLRYRHGFWAWNAGPSLRCKGEQWIPFMSGFGGIIVALFPNGSSYYYVSDGHDYAWAAAARASNALRPFCTPRANG